MGEREERFTDLFASAYASLWAYARRRVPPDDVDDVVADVFAVAWRRLDEVSADNPLPWLYGVGYKTIANVYRSHKRRLRLVQRLAAEPAPFSDPAEDSSVIDALATLSPDDQEILRLAAWEQLDTSEIALCLGCSINAAALRLSRARKKLRQRLTGSPRFRTQPGRKEIDV